MYDDESRVIFIGTKKNRHSIILSAQNFIFDTVQFDKYHFPDNCQTQTCRLGCKTEGHESSLQEHFSAALQSSGALLYTTTSDALYSTNNIEQGAASWPWKPRLGNSLCTFSELIWRPHQGERLLTAESSWPLHTLFISIYWLHCVVLCHLPFVMVYMTLLLVFWMAI